MSCTNQLSLHTAHPLPICVLKNDANVLLDLFNLVSIPFKPSSYKLFTHLLLQKYSHTPSKATVLWAAVTQCCLLYSIWGRSLALLLMLHPEGEIVRLHSVRYSIPPVAYVSRLEVAGGIDMNIPIAGHLC